MRPCTKDSSLGKNTKAQKITLAEVAVLAALIQCGTSTTVMSPCTIIRRQEMNAANHLLSMPLNLDITKAYRQQTQGSSALRC